MILIVTGIGTLIHLYSMGYMAHDKSVWRFFAYLNLFLFSMILLVLGDNLLMTFVGWEGVGLCSYLLIGFWYEEGKNAAAGMKAFVVNRIGDLGFILGIFTLIALFGTVNYVSPPEVKDGKIITPLTAAEVAGGKESLKLPEQPGLLDRTDALRIQYVEKGAALPESVPQASRAAGMKPFQNMSFAALITLACLCLFVGACGKSAQIPLYVWLPDAMAGPTPVSALIHAATMVTAGIYMVCRLHPLFALSPTTLSVIAFVGALTALFSALIGLTQLDIKKVLAYSTVSQLGYMFLGLGAGMFSLGIFHVLTHAFFKALLFLGAGSVIHAMSGEQDMRKMGGLWKKLPWTFWTMLIGAAALAGVPFLSGWYSKDEILVHTLARYHDAQSTLYLVCYLMGAVAAFCTAFYTFRLIFLTFSGENRASDEVKHHIHESPWTMLLPLVVLAFLSLAGGKLFEHAFVEDPLEKLDIRNVAFHEGPEAVHHVHVLNLVVTAAAAVLGIGLAFLRYGKQRIVPDPEKSGNKLVRASWNKFYVDEIYDAAIVFPFKVISEILHWGMDTILIDGIICGSAGLVRTLSGVIRRVQTGLLNTYAFAILGGTAVLLIYLFLSLK
jgi:NADH-quinone oxidoreductase subunit L